ncbi:hexose transporter hxt1 [Ascosphaera acerosa]|nr:hexose transporter hxt1 [Ascosphaera acerosa]
MGIERSPESEPDARHSVSGEKEGEFTGDFIETPLPLITPASLFLCLLISMGGFIFGFDTGQISGFLEMENFLNYFGQGEENHKHFSNVRRLLIYSILM